jgi:hypothetical protein
MHGELKDGWLIKKGKQVQKYWKFNGYAIPFKLLASIKGVVLYTQYDGVLYATSADIMKHGLRNNFQGEEQLVLPLKHWRIKNDTAGEAKADNH